MFKEVTAIKVKIGSSSPSLDLGRMEAIAKAADAPQIATAPPVNTPKRACLKEEQTACGVPYS